MSQFGLLDGAFELRREFQFVFDQIIKPFTNLAKLCLRKVAQFGLHLFDFAHGQMIQWNFRNFKRHPALQYAHYDGKPLRAITSIWSQKRFAPFSR